MGTASSREFWEVSPTDENAKAGEPEEQEECMRAHNRIVLKWLGVILAALAGVFSVVALLIVAPTSNSTAVRFTKLAEYVLWVYYVAILIGVVILTLPWIWSIVTRIIRIRSEIAPKVHLTGMRQIVAVLCLFYTTFLIIYTIGQFRDASRSTEIGLIPIPNWPLRISVTMAVTLLVAGPSIVGLWLGGVSAAAIRRFAVNLPQRTNGQIFWTEDHLLATMHLADLAVLQKRLLAFLSAGVSSLVLGPGLLRAAELAWNPAAHLPSSARSLVSFGGLFAVFIAISYAPTVVIGEDARTKLLGKIMPLPSNGKLSAEWCEHREAIERVLLPRNSLGTGLQIGIAVFAPIIAALATSAYSLGLS